MDSATLRTTLLQTENTLPSIQRSAAGMMSHYDRIPSIAVDVWRQCLASCRADQLLPLLYVANEVIQTSKRNRGNKYLEAFSPVLGSSLRLACGRDRSIVEKVRRTVKIWGDRKVFSVRFLGELLSGLESFRAEKTHSEGSSSTATSTGSTSRSSPAAVVRTISSPAVGGSGSGRSTTAGGGTASKLRRTSSAGSSSAPTSEGGSDDDDIFGTSHREQSLNIDFIGDFTMPTEEKSLPNTTTTAATTVRSAMANPKSASNTNKRKRPIEQQDLTMGASKSSPGGSATVGGTSSSGRRSLLAKKKASLADILDELETLKSQCLMSQSFVASIPESYFSTDTSGMESMVGDELLDMYKKVFEVERNATRHCIKFHGIARRRRTLEEELVQSIPQLRMQMRQDEEDLRLCEQLESKIQLLLPHYDHARDDRERKRQEERVKQEASEAEARKREEEELKKREFEEILKSTQSGAGMVWNPAAKEYQAVHDVTMESWRD